MVNLFYSYLAQYRCQALYKQQEYWDEKGRQGPSSLRVYTLVGIDIQQINEQDNLDNNNGFEENKTG